MENLSASANEKSILRGGRNSHARMGGEEKGAFIACLRQSMSAPSTLFAKEGRCAVNTLEMN